MRARDRVCVLAGAIALVGVLPTAAALAADATGCSGSVESLAADGSALDTASAPGEGGTESDPLVIDPQGSVAWEGSTDTAITDGSWSVSVGGVPFRSGTVDNADGKTSSSGVVDLAGAPAPVQWVLTTNAKIPVTGQMSGSGGTCTGSGYVTGTGGSPLTSPVFFAGAGLAVLGGAMAAAVAAGTKVTGAAATQAAAGVPGAPPAGGAS